MLVSRVGGSASHINIHINQILGSPLNLKVVGSDWLGPAHPSTCKHIQHCQDMLESGSLCWHMLEHASLCYGSICWHMFAYASICSHVVEFAAICSHMPAYAGRWQYI